MQVLLVHDCFKFFAYITCSVQQIYGLGGTLWPKNLVWSTCGSKAYLRVFVIPCAIQSFNPCKPLWNTIFGMDSEAHGVAMRSMNVILMLAVLWHFRACDRGKR